MILFLNMYLLMDDPKSILVEQRLNLQVTPSL